MNLLREYIKELLTKASITKPEIEDAIATASFNSGQSSQHRWSPRQPIIDYYFDSATDDWKFQAAIPDGTPNAKNWPRLPEDDTWSDKSIEDFLTEVEETSYQLRLPLEITESSSVIPLGQCYPHAVKMAKDSTNEEFADLSKFKVTHGRVIDKYSGESVLHAWVEKGDMVFDWQTHSTKPDGIPKDVYYDMYAPEIHNEYTAEETMVNCLKSGQAGPWR